MDNREKQKVICIFKCLINVFLAVYNTKRGAEAVCRKDTGVFDDDVSCSLVKHHLIEDVDDLTHKLIVLLLGCIQQTGEM